MSAPDYPPLQLQAGSVSRRQKQLVLALVAVRLFCLILIAVLAGLATVWTNSATLLLIISAMSFAIVFVSEMYARLVEPEKEWYDARSLSETVKSLAWRYCMQAKPFDGNTDADDSSDEYFENELAALRAKYQHITLPARLLDQRDPLSQSMRSLRRADFEVRKASYKANRLDDQEKWFVENSELCSRRGRRWSVILVFLSAAGCMMAFLQIVKIVNFDAMGMLGACATAGIAWVQTRQFRGLAHEYSIAAARLNGYRLRFAGVNATDLPRLIADIEDDLALEHAAWQVAHRKPQW